MSNFPPHIQTIESVALHQYFGFKLLEAENGKAKAQITVTDNVINPAGMLHGGVVYSLCDVICYLAFLSKAGEDAFAATHDIFVSVLRSARAGDIVTFEGEITKLGKNLAFLESNAYVDGKKIATAKVTKSIL